MENELVDFGRVETESTMEQGSLDVAPHENKGSQEPTPVGQKQECSIEQPSIEAPLKKNKELELSREDNYKQQIMDYETKIAELEKQLEDYPSVYEKEHAERKTEFNDKYKKPFRDVIAKDSINERYQDGDNLLDIWEDLWLEFGKCQKSLSNLRGLKYKNEDLEKKVKQLEADITNLKKEKDEKDEKIKI